MVTMRAKIKKVILFIVLLLIVSYFPLKNNFRKLASNNIIPTDNTCINFTQAIIKYSFAYKDVLNNLKLKAESANSATDLINMIDWAFAKGLDIPEIREATIGSPYFKELKVSQAPITRALIEIKQSQSSNFLSAVDAFKKYIPSFKNGFKAIDKARYYDSTIATLAVKDQCRIGSCWAYGSTSFLEQVLSKKLGKKVELSTKHYYGQYIANEVKKNLFRDPISPKGELYKEGGRFDSYMAYIKNFGIMPKSAYKLPVAYDKEPHKTQLYNSLREILDRFHKVKDKILKKEIDHSIKEQEIQRYRVKYAKEIDDEVQRYSGDFKQTFTFEGKKYNPVSFYNEYIADQIPTLKLNKLGHNPSDLIAFSEANFKVDKDGYPIMDIPSMVKIFDENLNPQKNSFKVIGKYIPVYPDKLKDSPIANIFPEIIEKYSKDKEKILKIIKSEIDNKKPIYISIDVTDNTYIDPVTKKEYKIINSETGKITTHGLNKRVGTHGGHALLVVGYEVNHKGELKTIKMQNSWGTRHGDDGFLHMDISYFKKYGRNIVTLP